MEEIKNDFWWNNYLRDGKWISTNDVSKISTEQIISMMVGRDLTERFPKKDNTVKEMILEVKNLKKYFQTPKGQLHAVDNVNFAIEEGKTLGVVWRIWLWKIYNR